MRRFWLSVLVLLATATGWGVQHFWRRTLTFSIESPAPLCMFQQGRGIAVARGRFLIAEIAGFDDELFAYLMFDYLRSSTPMQNAEVLLTYRDAEKPARYRILVHPENDLLGSIPWLARLQADHWISDFDWRFVDARTLTNMQRQTQVFIAAYNLPVRRKLEHLHAGELAAYLRRFLRFKSMTDLRVRQNLAPFPEPLTSGEAFRLASDIIAVAQFFDLPLDFFLGIGAMENNYMDVKGDLGNAVWKRRRQKGDIVLKRRQRRVLVLNESSGIWQITRETLRYAHRLYLKDGRDYRRLPEHLRPPPDLNLDEVDAELLTTYAGILFCDLLDRFHGDAAKAIGAYNGGPGSPNPQYEAGVRLVAGYARKIVEQAAALQGQSVVEISFFTPR